MSQERDKTEIALSDALRTVSKWLNEEIGGEPPRHEIAHLCAELQLRFKTAPCQTDSP